MNDPAAIDQPDECSWEAAIMRALHKRHREADLTTGDWKIYGGVIELIVCLKAEVAELKSQLDVQRAKEKESVLKDIAENIVDLDPEFNKAIDENFWDLQSPDVQGGKNERA